MEIQKLELTTVNINELINFTSALIEFDNTGLINSAQEVTAKYKDLVVTEDVVPAIKKEVAELNKLVTQLEDQRKSIKRSYNEPYDSFESKIKQVTSIINGTVSNLKQQLSVFEEQEKQAKLLKVKELIANVAIEFKLNEKYALQLVFVDKFLNVSETMPKIKKALDEQAIRLAEAQTNEIKAEQLRLEMEEMKQAQIERAIVARKDLLQHLNTRYELNVSYNEVRHLQDIAVHEYFETKKHNIQNILNKAKDEVSAMTELDSKIIGCGGKSITEEFPYKDFQESMKIELQKTIKSWRIEIDNMTKNELDEVIEGIKEYYPNATVKLI